MRLTEARVAQYKSVSDSNWFAIGEQVTGGSKVSSKKSTRTTPTTGQKSQEVPAEKSTAKRTAGREKNGQ